MRTLLALLLLSLLSCSFADSTRYIELDPNGASAITIRMADYYDSSVADSFNLVTIPSDGKLYQTDPSGHKIDGAISAPGLITGFAGSLVYEPDAFTTPLVDSFSVKAMLATNEVSEDEIKVLLHKCLVSIPDLDPWGGNVSPPSPTTATITYNAGTQKFDVTVDVAYLRDNAVYVIDFSNFNPNIDDVREVTSCTNRIDLTSVSDANFNSLFLSAPDAEFLNALDGSEFIAYPQTGTLWSVAATTCGAVRYTASFTFAQLSACTLRAGGPSITVADTGSAISYTGSLYVNVIQPLDPLDADAGYEKTQFAYPFSFTYDKVINTLATISSTNDFSVTVNSVTLDSGGKLAMVISSSYVDGELSPTVSVDAPTNGASLSVSFLSGTCGASPCVQKWTVVSAAPWALINNGGYKFHFTATTSGAALWASIDITQSLNQIQSGSFSFANALAFYASSEAFIAGTPALAANDLTYGASDKVYVREEVTVADGDRSKFTLSIVNAWICYTSIAGFTITSCTDPFLSDRERFQLVSSGAVNPIFNRFNTVVFDWPSTAFQDSSKLAAGIQFDAQPLTFQSEEYTVHLQVSIANNEPGRRRQQSIVDRVIRSPVVGNSGNFTGAFHIDSSDSAGAYLSVSLTSVVIIATVMIVGML